METSSEVGGLNPFLMGISTQHPPLCSSTSPERSSLILSFALVPSGSGYHAVPVMTTLSLLSFHAPPGRYSALRLASTFPIFPARSST